MCIWTIEPVLFPGDSVRRNSTRTIPQYATLWGRGHPRASVCPISPEIATPNSCIVAGLRRDMQLLCHDPWFPIETRSAKWTCWSESSSRVPLKTNVGNFGEVKSGCECPKATPKIFPYKNLRETSFQPDILVSFVGISYQSCVLQVLQTNPHRFPI